MVCNIANILSRIDFTEVATVVMAIFTGCLWYSNRKLWKTTAESIELARKEFIATHRPKLKVFSVFFDGDRGAETWQFQCSIHNVGESVAIIKTINQEFKILKEPLPIPQPYGESLFIEKEVKSGENIIEQFPIKREILWNIIRENPQDYKALYFFGYVDYLDNIGIMRRTAFCRRFDSETECFTKIDNEDYEYSY